MFLFLSYFSCKNRDGKAIDTERKPYTLLHENGMLKESLELVNGNVDGYHYSFLESVEKFREYSIKYGKLKTP